LIAKDRRISWALTVVLMGFLYVLIAEGAGAMHRLARGTVLALWLMVDAALLAAVLRMFRPNWGKLVAGAKEGRRRFLALVGKKPSWPLWTVVLLVLVAGMMLLLGAVALACPTTAWDSLTYHVPRVMRWLQQGNLSPYPTSIVRQLESAPGAELQSATLVLLTGDDWALNLPQWWALLTCGLLASLLSERLLKWHFGRQKLDGARVRWCGLFAALIVVTLPAAVPQAISSLNDLLAAQWVMLLVVFGVLLIQEPGNYIYASGMGGALALGITNKPTMFIYAAPFVGALVLWLLRKSLRMLSVLVAVTVVVGLAANMPWMRRNYDVFHNALGSKETLQAQPLADYAPTKMAANVIRNLSLYTDTPFDWSTSLLKHVLRPGIELLGETPDDKGSVWAGTTFSFPLRGSVVKSGDGFGGMMVVLPVLLSLLFFARKFNWKSPVLVYIGLVLAGFALFCGYLRWQPWHQRLHLPLFILAAPFVGMVLGWVWKRWVVLAVSLLLVLNALLILYYFPPYPIRLLTERSAPTREALYFSQRPELYEGTAELARDIVSTGTTNVCLYIGPDTWEYQFWVCLKDRGYHGTIQHVFVTNESATLAVPVLDSPGTAIVCTDEINIPLLSGFGLRVSYDRWAAYYWGKPEMRLKLVANQKVFDTHFDHPTLLQMRCNPVDQNGAPITNNVIRMQVGNYARDIPITSEQVLLEWHFPPGRDRLTVYCHNPLSTNQRIMTLANYKVKYIPDGN